MEALHLIERLVADGSLEVAEELFTEPISVKATGWAPQIAGAYVADVGTAMPESLTEPLGSEWREVHDLAGLNFPDAGRARHTKADDPS